MKVKILGLAFSPRHGNTEILVKRALRAAEEIKDVSVEFYSAAGKEINPCVAEFRCFKSPNPEKPCPEFTDAFDEIVPLVNEADGLIIGCPVYYMTVTAQLKAFMDRSMAVEALGYPWRNKVVGCVTCAYDRNGGHETTIRDMQNFCLMHDMILVGVGPERPSKGIGGYLGAMVLQGFPYPKSSTTPEGLRGVEEDEVGMYAVQCVGWRVAEIAKVVKAGFDSLPKNETHWPRGAIELEFLKEWAKKK